jgi:hypothetical protein
MPPQPVHTALVEAIFNTPPMPWYRRAASHVAWGLRHPYWALCMNVARSRRIRKYVLDTTAPAALSPMLKRMVLVTTPHEKLLDTLWDVIPRRDGWPNVTREFRGRALALVGSRDESIWWVYEREPGLWYADEVETDTGAWGYSPAEAIANYYAGNFDKPAPPLPPLDSSE